MACLERPPQELDRKYELFESNGEVIPHHAQTL